MSEAKTWQGGCHCGAVRFEVTMALENLMTCNCSLCSRSGTILTFTPADQFKLLSGEDALTEYRFNREVIAHLFCKTCGIRSFSRGSRPDGTQLVAINVRCLDGIEVSELETREVDGRSL